MIITLKKFSKNPAVFYAWQGTPCYKPVSQSILKLRNVVNTFYEQHTTDDQITWTSDSNNDQNKYNR